MGSNQSNRLSRGSRSWMVGGQGLQRKSQKEGTRQRRPDGGLGRDIGEDGRLRNSLRLFALLHPHTVLVSAGVEKAGM